MKIFIDNLAADVDLASPLEISLSAVDIDDLDSGAEDRTVEVILPMTARNMEIMGDVRSVDSIARYNRESHTARIEKDGALLFAGEVRLKSTRLDGSGGYNIGIVRRGYEWIRRASKAKFKDIDIDFREAIYDDTIWKSWTWDKPVRWLPVLRDTLKITSEVGIAPAKMMTARDYHPFLHIRTMMERIAGEGGYTIKSEFMNGEEFDTLYMSGRYHDRNIEPYKARMDFLAGRSTAPSATADSLGQVYADPLTTYNSLGAIVNTATVIDNRSDRVDYKLYTVNGCFSLEGGRPMFKPLEPIEVSFEYKLRYTTDYRVKDRDTLTGFDIITLDDLVPQKYVLTNPYADRRESGITVPFAYRAVAFDEADAGTAALRLTADVYDAAGVTLLSQGVVLCDFTGRSATFGTTAHAGKSLKNLSLLHKSGASYLTYDKDWAVYDLVDELSGTMEVASTMRSRAQRVYPSESKYFDLICFGGAKEGMKFTLDKSVTIRPMFSPQPLVGSTVDFSDVATAEMYQIELFKAMKQMFNLCVLTDPVRKEIIIEPRDRFFRSDVVVDWSGKADLSKPVEVADFEKHGMASNTMFRYRPEDGAVLRWDESNNTVFGRWNMRLRSRFLRERNHEEVNPVFSPTINKFDAIATARTASIPQVGDRDRSGVVIDAEDLNFPSKIVRYKGMQTLRGGDMWGWPTFAREYPFAAFHMKKDPDNTGLRAETLPGEPMHEEFTLCFEDRDGLPGQHRYYDSLARSIENDRIITIFLRLSPQDVEPLVSPGGLCRDFRALYKITVDSEPVYARLLSIEDYDPSAESTRCVFRKENAAV